MGFFDDVGNMASVGAGGFGSFVGNTVGGLTGNLAKGLTPQNDFHVGPPLDPTLLNGYMAGAQGNLGQNQTQQQALVAALMARGGGQGMSQQNALASQLQAQAMGNGPNPAAQALHQATNQNIAQSTGMIASQKGISPALAARLASENAGRMNQQAAGQAATMQAEQQLGAQSQLGNIYGQIQGQQAQAFQNAGNIYGNMGNQNLQNFQSSGQLANDSALGAQRINAATAAQNTAATQNTNSGILNSIGQALMPSGGGGKAHGGMIQKYADGGQVFGQGGMFGKSNSSAGIAQQMLADAGVPMWQNGVTPLNLSMPKAPMAAGGSETGLMAGGADAADIGGMATMVAAHGGKVPHHLHPIARIYHPQMMTKGPAKLKAEGGKVPGKAQVAGDSERNDTVSTMLSPGEIVLPRSVVNAPDPAAAAAKFVAEHLKKRDEGASPEDFKAALKKAISSRKGK